MRKISFSICMVALSLGWAAAARADVKLPAVIDSHMVLQRDRPLPIWGWAEPGEEVTVTLDAQKASATADDKGNWKVMLKPVQADGKPHTMTVAGKNKIVLEDLLIGEVWLGSGQSNMQWAVNQSKGAKEYTAAADKPRIRLFNVPLVQNGTPAKDVKAKWAGCSPKNVGGFSAVLYHFGVKLQNELDVPVGLINASWGGSRIEPWLVEEKSSGGMYNGMIAPVQPFALRGFTWYQGESNVGEGMKYRDKMETLIKGWRRVWGADLPFYHVQIAPFSGYGADKLPPLWEAQVASLKIPCTGMVVCTDLVPNVGDIHPNDKQPYGERLALWALARDYGKKDLVYSGPLYKSMKIEGAKIRVSFAHVGGGLQARGGKTLSEFEIAGKDGKFVPAEATLDGSTVVVQAKEVAEPTQVRYGWRNTANPNLMNKEGLPASPFRSQDWQGGTAEVASQAATQAGEKTERVYEMRTYYAPEGRLDDLHTRFRDHTVKLFEKHGMTSIGYWTPIDNKENKLVYILAYPSRDAAKKSWAAFGADPAWKAVKKETEAKGPIVAKVESLYLKATDYSPEPKLAAKGDRIFEMRTYTATPKNLDNLNARFRNHTVKLFEKHGMTNIGYWVPLKGEKGADDVLVYFLAHKSVDAAKQSFAAFREDPAWKAALKASEENAGGPLTVPKTGVKSVMMKATDYSPMR